MKIKDCKCSKCKHWGGQGTAGLITEMVGDERTCMAYMFGDLDNPNFKPMPNWIVTYGNLGNAKGKLTVHKDYGCVNQNQTFD